MADGGRVGFRRWAPWLLAAVLAAIGVGRVVAVAGLLPYSQHVDERFFTAPVADMLRSGDPNPGFFRYPSLPLYVTTGLVAATAAMVPGESIDAVRPARLGVAYATPTLYAVPRVAVALLSVAALGLLAIVAWRLDGPGAAVATPILLGLSATVQKSAVEYLNVDVFTVLFVAATLAVVVSRWDDPGLRAKAVLPGVLAGLVIASKYNSGLVLLPCLLAIRWAGGPHRLRQAALLLAVAGGTFVLCVPYSVLDFPTFLGEIRFELEHYGSAKGFGGVEPGVDQLAFFLAAIAHDFGWPAMGLAVLGGVRAGRRHPRPTLAVVSLPVAMLLYMSTQSANFLRSILPVYAVLAVLQAVGLAGALELVRAGVVAARETGGDARRRRLAAGAALALLAGVVATAQGGRLLDLDVAPDPRNRAVAWLAAGTPPGARILVADDLRIAPRDRARLGAVPLAPGLTDLARRIGEAPAVGTWVVVPAYVAADAGRPRGRRGSSARAARRFEALEARLARLEATPGARAVLELPGRPVRQAARDAEPAAPVYRPAVRVFALGAEAERPPAPAGRRGGAG